MRLMEFLTPEEWAQFEQLIFDGAWKALATYQQQRASQRLQQMKPIAQLKPKATARNGQLARQAKRASHAAPPKPLPKPAPAKKLAPATAQASTSYNPVKTPKPLPASTRDAIVRPDMKSQEAIQLPSNMDQRGRAMLPKSKRGPNIWDMVNLD